MYTEILTNLQFLNWKLQQFRRYRGELRNRELWCPAGHGHTELSSLSSSGQSGCQQQTVQFCKDPQVSLEILNRMTLSRLLPRQMELTLYFVLCSTFQGLSWIWVNCTLKLSKSKRELEPDQLVSQDFNPFSSPSIVVSALGNWHTIFILHRSCWLLPWSHTKNATFIQNLNYLFSAP